MKLVGNFPQTHNARLTFKKVKLALPFDVWQIPSMCKEAMRDALEKAVKKEGSRGRVAKKLGISRQATIFWEKLGYVPARHVLALEQMSGVSRYNLRPDIYGPPPGEHGVAA